MKLEADAARLDKYAEYTAEQLATMLPPDQVDGIVKLRKLKMQENMNLDQIKAMNSGATGEKTVSSNDGSDDKEK